MFFGAENADFPEEFQLEIGKKSTPDLRIRSIPKVKLQTIVSGTKKHNNGAFAAQIGRKNPAGGPNVPCNPLLICHNNTIYTPKCQGKTHRNTLFICCLQSLGAPPAANLRMRLKKQQKAQVAKFTFFFPKK
jgi:hypothetical protein